MQLSITTLYEGTSCLLSVAGEVDISSAGDLRSALDAALEHDCSTIEVDLSQVPYIDSTGIGVLVGASQRAGEADKTLSAIRPQANVERVFGLLGVIDELHVHTNET